MPKNPVPTNWNPSFDDKPTSDVPRIKFSRNFSEKYLDKKSSILEVGCGIGSYTRFIDRKGCYAIDLDINAIRIAKKYCVYPDFIVASALDLPFKNDTFESVCMWGVFEEIPRGGENEIVVGIQKILKTDGVFLLSVYTDHLISKLFDPAFIFRGVRHYDQESFLNLIRDSGMIVKEYTVRGGVNTIISNFLVYFYKHFLKKKEGSFKKYFDNKSTKEINLNENGLIYLYVAASKKMPNNSKSEM